MLIVKNNDMAFKKDFEELLASTKLSSELGNEEYSIAWEKINDLLRPNIPQQLFRFRTCNTDSLIAFQKGKISTCVPRVFKDKYDSLVYVDKKGLEGKIREFMNLDILRGALDNEEICNFAEVMVGKDFIAQMKEAVSLYDREEWTENIVSLSDGFINHALLMIDSNVDYVRSDSFSRIACFTEDIKSLCMWDTYADGYRGFALEYDFRDFHKRGCWACSDSCACQHEGRNFSHLFPIIYTDKRYDASDNVVSLVVRNLLSAMGIDKCPPIDQLYWYKPYLYKNAKSYAHEREWRLISHCPARGTSEYANISDWGTMKAIYYGPDIEKRYKDFLHEVAKQKQLQEYEVHIDPYSIDFEPKITPLL